MRDRRFGLYRDVMSAFTVDLVTDPAEFRALAFDFLLRDPVRHSVILTNVDDRARGLRVDAEAPRLAIVRVGAEVVGAAMRTTGYEVFLGEMPLAAVHAVADAYAAAVPALPGVNGEFEHAGAFARRWCAVAGGRAEMGRRSRLFALGELRPTDAAGAARWMTLADAPLLRDWLSAFVNEIGDGEVPPAELVAARLAADRYLLWERDGRPVSMAGRTPQLYGVTRIGPVYTPPAERGHGYASAVTSRLSAEVVASGSRACLYTDVANPTSNKIYQDIGFEPVCDRVVYAFLPS